MNIHKHLIIRAEALNPPTSESFMETWLINLVQHIQMKILVGPFASYCHTEGNRGLTAGAIIETSHIMVHVWDEIEPSTMQIDIYSCSAFDPHDICNLIKRDFDVVKMDYKFLDRQEGLVNIL